MLELLIDLTKVGLLFLAIGLLICVLKYPLESLRFLTGIARSVFGEIKNQIKKEPAFLTTGKCAYCGATYSIAESQCPKCGASR